MTDDLLFVYGTLRKDIGHAAHAQLLSQAEYLGKATIKGELYEISAYPGLIFVNHPLSTVQGELYRTPENALFWEQLDLYEECAAVNPLPHEYQRRRVPVRSAQGDEVTAWVYLYAFDVSNRLKIVSGDYRQYLQNMSESDSKRGA